MEFIFLEITDPEINGFLSDVIEITSGKRPNKAIHLTIRGPYKNRITNEQLDRYKNEIKNDVIKIEGVGRFSNEKEEVVFLKVDSPNLKRIWWKPDFPQKNHGYNPHISLYRGKDKFFADKFVDFLRNENIKILCANFEIVTYIPLKIKKQLNLFQREVNISDEYHYHIRAGMIKADFIERVKNVVESHKRCEI